MIFKNKILYLVALVATFAWACNDYEEDAFDFDNAFPQYVDFAAGSAGVEVDTLLDINGDLAANVGGDTIAIADLGPMSVALAVRLRVARQSDTDVTVAITGDINETVNLTIPADALTTEFMVDVPYGADNLNGAATAAITTVSNGLTIGRTVPDGKDPVDVVEASITWSSL